jgi:hypothetical protein
MNVQHPPGVYQPQVDLHPLSFRRSLLFLPERLLEALSSLVAALPLFSRRGLNGFIWYLHSL